MYLVEKVKLHIKGSSMTEHIEAYYGLPSEVKFCKKCVISNQRPSSTVEFKNANAKKETIVFGEDGICDACRYNEIKQQPTERRKLFQMRNIEQ
jgi:hypothetical protein